MRFVGDPARRIAEDYLRILRFFRIHAWYGDPAGGLDAEGLAACAAAQDGLARLSRERVGAEIAQAPRRRRPRARRRRHGRRRHPRPGAARRRPARAGAAGARSRPRPAPRRAGSAGWRRSAGGPTGPRRCGCRAADARALTATAAALAAGEPPAADRLSPRRRGRARRGADPLPRAAAAGTRRDLEAELARGAAAVFPLAAADLGLTGPALGRALERLEAAWIASDFALGPAELRRLLAG